MPSLPCCALLPDLHICSSDSSPVTPQRLSDQRLAPPSCQLCSVPEVQSKLSARGQESASVINAWKEAKRNDGSRETYAGDRGMLRTPSVLRSRGHVLSSGFGVFLLVARPRSPRSLRSAFDLASLFQTADRDRTVQLATWSSVLLWYYGPRQW